MLIIILGITPIFRMDTSFLKLLQSQKYKLLTISKSLFLQPKNRLILDNFLFFYSIIFILHFVSFKLFYNQYFFIINRILIGFLALDSFITLFRFTKSTLQLPQFTLKTGTILVSTIIFQITIFTIWYLTNHFFIGLFFLLICPYFIITIAYFTTCPFLNHKKNKLKKQLQKHLQNSHIIEVSGWFYQFNFKHFLQQIYAQTHTSINLPTTHDHEFAIPQILLKQKYNYIISYNNSVIKPHTKVFLSQFKSPNYLIKITDNNWTQIQKIKETANKTQYLSHNHQLKTLSSVIKFLKTQKHINTKNLNLHSIQPHPHICQLYTKSSGLHIIRNSQNTTINGLQIALNLLFSSPAPHHIILWKINHQDINQIINLLTQQPSKISKLFLTSTPNHKTHKKLLIKSWFHSSQIYQSKSMSILRTTTQWTILLEWHWTKNLFT